MMQAPHALLGCPQHQPHARHAAPAQPPQLLQPRRVACSSNLGSAASTRRGGSSSAAARVPRRPTAAAAAAGGNGTTAGGEAFQPRAVEQQPQQRPKVFVFLRHGHSTWNEEKRIQGNTNESALTRLGEAQALRAREALTDIAFDSCFSSPHTRARQTAGIVWQRWQSRALDPQPHFLPSLSEVDLGWFQGLRNEDIAAAHPALYKTWREQPEAFVLDGRAPVRDAFQQARRAWADMLAAPGSVHLVITHKSLLRAMLCTALGLPESQFRAIDISNASVCMCRCNARGAIMLSVLNLTSHLQYGDVRYSLPGTNQNDRLAAASGYAGQSSNNVVAAGSAGAAATAAAAATATQSTDGGGGNQQS